MTTAASLTLDVDLPTPRRVNALWLAPEGEIAAVYAFAHGAGAGMQHAFMEAMATDLCGAGIATLRYQFPYMDAGSRRIDNKPVLLATVRAAVDEACRRADGRTVLAGGKSMGGRMTSLAAADDGLTGVAGLVFLGFPLHPAGRPGIERAEHLAAVAQPMLFVQGSRDKLATLDLLEPIVVGLGARARLLVVPEGDHGLDVPRRSGRTAAEVRARVVDEIARWSRSLS